ncbi:MAG: hypothetical protein KDA75_09680, partial [Planctomycetaceae bacterium]|nr:hypothetical protein [Planctomycetaceae bacterium]
MSGDAGRKFWEGLSRGHPPGVSSRWSSSTGHTLASPYAPGVEGSRFHSDGGNVVLAAIQIIKTRLEIPLDPDQQRDFRRHIV